MTKFIELTQENGTKLTVNVASLGTFASLGGDPSRGTAVTFNFSAGDKNAARSIRVTETYSAVRKLVIGR